MPDLLPDIQIIISQNESDFFRDAQTAVLSLSGYSGKMLQPGIGPQVFQISLPDDGLHVEGIALFIYVAKSPGSIRVELQSSGWITNPTESRDYATYAKLMLDPVLAEYNSLTNSKVELEIATEAEMEPSLPDLAFSSFKLFLAIANKGALHPLDWRRFYKFIRVCEASAVQLSGPDIRRLLQRSGFDAEYAEELSNIYDHGRGILRTTDGDE